MNFGKVRIIIIEMSLASRFKALPISARRLLGVGIVLALVVALPLFVWAISTQKFLIFKKAASGEPTPNPTPSVYLPAAECGYCGDIGDIPCQEGLTCKQQYGNAVYPDNKGLCLKNDGTSVCSPLPTPVTFFCIKHPPTLEITPQSQPGSPGATLIYTGKVKNNDEFVLPGTPGAEVCSLSFGAPKLVGHLPNGWTGVFNQTSGSIHPQKTGAISFTVTSPTSPAPASGPAQFTVDLQTLTSSTTLASASGIYEVLSTPNTNPPLCSEPIIPSGYLDTGSTMFTMALYAAGNQGNGTAIDGYRWDFDGNGTWDITNIGSTNTTFHYQYLNAGTYHPIYQVHNNSGIWSSNCSYPRTITINSPSATKQVLSFLFRFAGVSDNSAEGATVKAYFRTPDELLETPPLTSTYIASGIYKITFIPETPIPSTVPQQTSNGTQQVKYRYQFYLKGEKHIRARYCSIGFNLTLCLGNTPNDGDGIYIDPQGGTYDLTHYSLEPGDLPPQDGVVDNIDYDRVYAILSKPYALQTDQDKYIADLNYDGKVNGLDMFLLMKTLGTKYDAY